ncbi:hypothetical protein HK102_001391, partial [Quaeritorhiza haematococci]
MELECDFLYNLLPNNTEPIFAPSDIAIVSNGYCGSTCALFTTLLHELYGVRQFATGGFPNQPMSFSSFPGGQVYSLITIQSQASRFNVSNLAPGPWPILATVRFTLREAYAKGRTDVPLEF